MGLFRIFSVVVERDASLRSPPLQNNACVKCLRQAMTIRFRTGPETRLSSFAIVVYLFAHATGEPPGKRSQKPQVRAKRPPSPGLRHFNAGNRPFFNGEADGPGESRSERVEDPHFVELRFRFGVRSVPHRLSGQQGGLSQGVQASVNQRVAHLGRRKAGGRQCPQRGVDIPPLAV